MVKIIDMADTSEITKTEYEIYDLARGLLGKLKQYRKNPGSFHSRSLITDYGNLVNEYGLEEVEKMLAFASVDLDISRPEEVNKVGLFLKQEYETMLKKEVGEVANSDVNDADGFLEKIAGNHQAHGFKPRETGVKNRNVGDTQIFRNFAKKAEHETRKFFSIGEKVSKRKKGNTFLASFEEA